MSVKKDYQHKLEIELKEWDDRIKQLEALSDKAKPEDKVEYVEHIEYLRAKQKNIREKLEEIKQSHESIWQGIRDGVDSIFNDMVSYYEAIYSRFKE